MNAKMPSVDMRAKDFNMVQWTEKIELTLKDGEKNPTVQDQMDLISLLYSVTKSIGENGVIGTDCPVIRTLAGEIPEVEELLKSAENGKIELVKLMDILEPYLFGKKQLPSDNKPPAAK